MGQQRENRVAIQPRPNLTYLVELADGDEQFIIEVLTMFVSDTPESLKQCVVYQKTENYPLLKITVHKIKSSIKMLGNDDLSKLAQKIEDASQEKANLDIISELLPLFIRDTIRFTENLKVELAIRNNSKGE